MYKPASYYLSQATLEFFANKFNSLPISENIKWEYIYSETFKNDGCFIDVATGKTIAFDWELRNDDKGYFENGNFRFDTLGQFERKFDPSKNIKISIQSDSSCSAIVVGWHEDFKPESAETDNIRTGDESVKENSTRRFTEHFMVFYFDGRNKPNLWDFKQMISIAMQNDTYNHNVFEGLPEREYNVSDNKVTGKNLVNDNAPICPDCHIKMQLKNGKFGDFWACPNYYTEKNCKRTVKSSD